MMLRRGALRLRLAARINDLEAQRRGLPPPTHLPVLVAQARFCSNGKPPKRTGKTTDTDDADTPPAKPEPTLYDQIKSGSGGRRRRGRTPAADAKPDEAAGTPPPKDDTAQDAPAGKTTPGAGKATPEASTASPDAASGVGETPDFNDASDETPPKGFEKWFPGPHNPSIPVARAEYRKKLESAALAAKKASKKNTSPQQGPDKGDFFLIAFGMTVVGFLVHNYYSTLPKGEYVDFDKIKVLVQKGHLVKVEIYDHAVAQLTVREEDGVEQANKYYAYVGDLDVFEYKLEALQAEFASQATVQRVVVPAGAQEGDTARPQASAEADLLPRQAIPIVYRTNDHGVASLIWQCSLPLLVICFLAYRLPRAQKALQSEVFSKRNQKHKFEKELNVTTRFKDVAGLQETKQEILEVVDFLKSPEKYHRLGAKIPKGILLTGPPGVGKTLLAKATAGESGVPFFSVAGSDFMEVFVGVGPARVRELFKSAAEESPCIVFIDEIDAIGRKRQTSGKGSHDSEQESALNSILVEMDGFSSKTGVVVLAGTNRPDILDKALLRPGRFDRQVQLDKPPLADRIEIFELHLAPITLHPDVNKHTTAKRLAALTPGFSGADIMNTCNEAALVAARASADYVGMKAFEKAIEKILGGLEKTKKITPKEKRMVAYHEAGHVVVGWHLKHVDPVLKVSIIPRGGDKLGYTQHLPKDKYLSTQDEVQEGMIKLLGGRVAEELEFGVMSTGAADDMYRVTQMAKQQIVKFGFSTEKIGHFSFPEGSGNEVVIQKPYSERTEKLIDEEVEALVEKVYQMAHNILTEHRDQLELVAQRLLEKEEVTAEELIEMLGDKKFPSEELTKYIAAAAEARAEEFAAQKADEEAKEKKENPEAADADKAKEEPAAAKEEENTAKAEAEAAPAAEVKAEDKPEADAAVEEKKEAAPAPKKKQSKGKASKKDK